MNEQASIPRRTLGPAAGHSPSGPVEGAEAAPVNNKERRSLYKAREKIFPKAAHGAFRRLKWAVMAATLAIYYLAPWVRWERGANAPDQAILIDFPARKFYFFFIEIWPQEVYYLTGLLILAALVLFLITSLAGRVWCGYTCPQTVWTDLFIAVEHLIEGDRNARIRLDRAPWGVEKVVKRVATRASWLAIAVATGGAWVFYFADAPTLLKRLLAFDAPDVAYITIGILTFTTYLFGGFAREQVCTYMCPWPRIQGAMLDEESLTVTYRAWRGEPRASHKKGESWAGRGHCIDCNQCVAVCPMGIDIRDGLQLECTSCALCIDACDEVMERVGLPRGLIGYDTIGGLAAEARGERPRFRPVRPRTLAYAGLIALVGLVILGALALRSPLDINVLRDRNPLYVRLSDGSIRNGYTFKILNKRHEERAFRLAIEGVEPLAVSVVGQGSAGAGPRFTVAPDSVASFRLFVTLPAKGGESRPLAFVLTDLESGERARYESVFRGPRA